jgi:hypothetical protein
MTHSRARARDRRRANAVSWTSNLRERLEHGLVFGVDPWSQIDYGRFGPSMKRAKFWLLAVGSVALGCGGSGVGAESDWPVESKRWYDRALASYQSLDSEDARTAVNKALQAEPHRLESQSLAARIALAQLDYDATLEYSTGLTDSDAHALRARAFWYSGRIAEAGTELEALLADPDVKDSWAKEVLKLVRQGAGRQPFTLRGSLLAVTEMPRLPNSTAMLVPIELNGQPVLALLSTSAAEVSIDSAGREPSWVSVVFDGRVEVKDVPALPADLSGISREVGAPVKVLLGTNILRHLNATFDYLGRQFVVRNYEPPPPPVATRVPLAYIRGGGMVLRSTIGTEAAAPEFNLFLDSASTFAIALDDQAWKRTNVDPANLLPVPGADSGVRQTRLSQVKLGAFGVPSVPAVSGVGFGDLEQTLGIELDGLLGSGLLSNFRVTLAEGGRTLWFEDLPTIDLAPAAEGAPPEAAPGAAPELLPPG